MGTSADPCILNGNIVRQCIQKLLNKLNFDHKTEKLETRMDEKNNSEVPKTYLFIMKLRYKNQD